MKKSSPAWSFLGKVSVSTRIDQAPGPGSYNPKEREGSPSWGLSKSPRMPPDTSFAPGPGSYKLSKSLTGKKFPISFGKAKRLDSFSLQSTPGPGAYTIPLRSSSPSISIKNTRYEYRPNGVPGPGSYLIKDQQKIPPSYSVGRAVKLKTVFNQFPGPGNYSLTPSTPGPSWRIGLESKDNFNYCKTPGPGSYFINKQSELPSFTMKTRYESKKKEDSPGPGAYSPSHVEKRIKVTLGSAEKMPFKPAPVPGPGSYSPLSNGKHKFGVMGKTERKLLEVANKTPGAGAYETKSSLDGPKFSLSSKHILKSPDVPGPGAYSPSYLFKNLPNVKIGKEKRLKVKVNENPGPGTYQPEVGESSPKWKFGNSPKGEMEKRGIPGPGEYEIKATVPSVAHYYNIS